METAIIVDHWYQPVPVPIWNFIMESSAHTRLPITPLPTAYPLHAGDGSVEPYIHSMIRLKFDGADPIIVYTLSSMGKGDP